MLYDVITQMVYWGGAFGVQKRSKAVVLARNLSVGGLSDHKFSFNFSLYVKHSPKKVRKKSDNLIIFSAKYTFDVPIENHALLQNSSQLSAESLKKNCLNTGIFCLIDYLCM